MCVRLFFMARLSSLFFLLPLSLVLAGCASFEDSPTAKLLNRAVSHSGGAERTQFDPRFHYLRVVVEGHVIFMASGTPDIDAPGITSVWYSAGREVFRFRDGRLIAAVGMPREWRHVVLPDLPAWAALAQQTGPLRWTRTRDVMPGYRYGLRDHLVLQRISAPEDSNLKGLDAHSLVWFEERFDTTDAAARDDEVLPPARYALDARNGNRIVYGEQCLSAGLCFSWQRWPVAAGKQQ
jgi:hypothetical protein